MKTSIFTLLLAATISQSATAQDCTCQTLSGTLSTQTLDNDHCWILDECVIVPNNVTLTIEEGTKIYPNAGSALVVQRGGTVNVNGTVNNPVVFIPKLIADRSPGFWEGISVAGNGINNGTLNGSIREITLNGSCTNVSGGNSNTDNSGSITYMQLHFAEYGLQLGSIGTGTTIDNVQVTYSNNDGFTFRGGAVKATHLASFNAKGNDFFISNGYVGKMQYIFSFRQDASANLAGGSSGMVITNDASGTSTTPLSRPVISNYTTLGPLYCNGSASTNFNYGLNVAKNARGGIYNSVILSWKDEGFRIDDVSTVTNTDLDVLNYSFNSMDLNGSDYGTATAWTTGCTNLSMTDWLTNDPLVSCTEDGNQYAASITTTGYNSVSICGGSANPNFSLNTGTTDFSAPDFSASELSSGFTTTTYRGAFGSTDWTDSWTDWAPLSTDYCEARRMHKAAEESGYLRLIPNPAHKQTIAVFTLKSAGAATIAIMGNIDGKVLYSFKTGKLEAGTQSIPVDISTLQTGTYIIRVTTSDGVMQQHLMVK